MADFIKVASKSEISSGTGMKVSAGGQNIALFNVNGSFHAIADACSHRGGSLSEGDLDGCNVSCPLHGWTFDVTSGNATRQASSVKSYPVKIEGEDVFVEV